MKRFGIMAAAGLFAVSLSTPHTAPAQAPGITRTDLLQNDLSVPGREVIQMLVEIAPGVVAPNHTHLGEEIVYVVEGELEYALEGRPPVTVKGRGIAVHSRRNASRRDEPRQRQRGGARHVHRRQGQAAPHAG